MIKILPFLALLQGCFTGIFGQTAITPAGNGSEANPYQIATLENLYWLSQTTDFWDDNAHFIQTADIDARDTKNWNSGAGFSPIGKDYNTPFTGTYHGKNHVIKNLYINRTQEYVGLFGYIQNVAIDSLGVVGGEIKGNRYVAGVVAYAIAYNGTVCLSGCYNTGNVTTYGSYTYAGGVTGYAIASSPGTFTLSGCYNTGSVTASDPFACAYAGGTVGWGLGTVTLSECFWDTQTSQQVNAIGKNEGISLINVKGLTTSQMKNPANFTNWDFSSTSPTWQIHEDKTYPALKNIDNAPFAFRDTIKGYNISIELNKVLANDYDYETEQTDLVYQVKEIYGKGKVSNGIYSFPDKSIADFTDSLLYRVGELKAPGDTLWGNCAKLVVINEPEGTGTATDPYKIATLNDLKWLSQATSIWSKNLYYTQTADIDASDTRNWDDTGDGVMEGFSPIGNEVTFFTGTFHGQNHVIKNLYINRPITYEVGLFGIIKNATIDSLGVTGSDIKGKTHVGGIVGYTIADNGTVTLRRCYNTGSIKCSKFYRPNSSPSTDIYTGGLVGYIWVGDNGVTTLSGCYNTGSVTSSSLSNSSLVDQPPFVNAGGVIGFVSIYPSSSLSLSECYNTGHVTSSCFTTSSIIHAGAIVGFIDNYFSSKHVNLMNCFWDVQTSKQTKICEYSGNVVMTNSEGLTTDLLKQRTSFKGFDFDNTWQIRENQTYPALKDIDNAPFAFRDTIKGYNTSIELNKVLANDYDYETGQEHLVYQVKEVYGTGKVSNGIYSFPDKSIASFTDSLLYRVGEVKTPGDTLWGNCAKLVVINEPEGSGSETDPYLIYNYNDLKYMHNDLDAIYCLMNNIDASQSKTENDGKGWEPVGDYVNPFIGILHGKRFEISNLYVNSTKDYVGLIGFGKKSKIDSVSIVNSDIRGQKYTGSLAGAFEEGTITACYNTGQIKGSASDDAVTGGLVGYSAWGTIITSCYNSGTVSGFTQIGGLIGANHYASITNCYNTGAVYGVNKFGGLVGINEGAISNSYNIGLVSGPNPEVVGGLVGQNSGETKFNYNNQQTSEQANGIGYDYLQNNYVTTLTTSQMKQQLSYSGFDFNNTWQIREGKTYPALKGINNTPFAFRDTLYGYASINLKKVLANDYDYETGQNSLVYQVKEIFGAGKVSNGIYAFPTSSVAGFTDSLLYRVGEVLAVGDTLWGSCAKAVLIMATKIAVNITSVTLRPAEGSSSTFDITFDGTWKIVGNTDWLSVNTLSGSGNSSITVTATQNTTGNARTTTITLSATGAEDIIIIITQEAQINLTINLTATDKVYDGTTNAAVTATISKGLVTGDIVTVTVTNAQFDTKNMGTGKTVTAGITLSGADAGNYTIDAKAKTTANITATPLTISITAKNKSYDGNTGASVTATITSGLITGDDVTAVASNAQFDNASVGAGKAVTTDITLTGTDAGNYTCNTIATTTADILDVTAPTVTFSGITNNIHPNVTIILTFSEPVSLTALNLESALVIREGGASGNPVSYTNSGYTSSGLSQFNITASLKCGTSYYIAVLASAFADASGNATTLTEQSFTTVSNPDVPLLSGGNTTLCPGSALSITNFDNSLQYQWLKDNIAVNGETANQYTLPANSSGNYSVTAENTGTGCHSVSTVVPVLVYTVATPVIHQKADNAATLLIVDNTSNAFTGYQWYNADGSSLPSSLIANRQFLTLTGSDRTGQYLVRTTDRNGCIMQSAQATIKATTASARVYPTVNNGSFKVDMIHPDNGLVLIKVVSQRGTPVKQYSHTKGQENETFELNIGAVANGNYMVEISMGTWKEVKWIVVQ